MPKVTIENKVEVKPNVFEIRQETHEVPDTLTVDGYKFKCVKYFGEDVYLSKENIYVHFTPIDYLREKLNKTNGNFLIKHDPRDYLTSFLFEDESQDDKNRLDDSQGK